METKRRHTGTKKASRAVMGGVTALERHVEMRKSHAEVGKRHAVAVETLRSVLGRRTRTVEASRRRTS